MERRARTISKSVLADYNAEHPSGASFDDDPGDIRDASETLRDAMEQADPVFPDFRELRSILNVPEFFEKLNDSEIFIDSTGSPSLLGILLIFNLDLI